MIWAVAPQKERKEQEKVMYTTADTGHKALNKTALLLDDIFCRSSRFPAPACHRSRLYGTERRQKPSPHMPVFMQKNFVHR
jgi:hypothetical protein